MIHSIDPAACTGCGTCTEKCPTKNVPDAFNEDISTCRAINIPFPQAIPKKATINPDYCRKIKEGKCGVCAKVCPTGAIVYDMVDEIVEEKVGAIIAATGYDLLKTWSLFTVDDIPLFATGLFFAFLFGWLAIKTFIALVGRITLRPFAVYRLLLAPIVYFFMVNMG